MIFWFFLALWGAVFYSLTQAYSNYLVSSRKFSKAAISFYSTGIASIILFVISVFRGFPAVDERFLSLFL